MIFEGLAWEIKAALAGSPYLAEKALTPKERAKLPAKAFVFPEKRAWPIHDLEHAKIALVWSTWPQHRKVAKTVRKAVFKKWPQLIAKFPKLAKSVGIKVKAAKGKKKKRARAA